jgi:cell division protein FtsB
MSARAEQVRARRPRHLTLVRRRSRKLIRRGESRRLAPTVIAGSILAVALVFGVLLEQVVLAQSAFKLAEIRQRLARAEQTQEELRLSAARLSSPARIERYARDYLGMVDPYRVEYIVADIRSTASVRVARIPPREQLENEVGIEEAAP